MNIVDDVKMQYKMGGFELKIIFWNIAIFLVSLVFFYQFKGGYFNFPEWISLSSNVSGLLFKPWTVLTYAFFHAGFMHLFFNMIVLNFSGRIFLTFFTQKQFLGLYLLGAIFAGLIFILSYTVLGLGTSAIVGASGAIMAVLVSGATYAPFMNLRLLLIGNVKLWQVTFVILLLDLIQISVENTGGHIAHLAGALFGFIFVKLLQNGTDLSKGVTFIIDKIVNLTGKRQEVPFKKVHRNYSKVNNSATKIVMKDKSQQQIDEILDKISQSGYDSLTSEEKEFLFKAGK